MEPVAGSRIHFGALVVVGILVIGRLVEIYFVNIRINAERPEDIRDVSAYTADVDKDIIGTFFADFAGNAFPEQIVGGLSVVALRRFECDNLFNISTATPHHCNPVVDACGIDAKNQTCTAIFRRLLLYGFFERNIVKYISFVIVVRKAVFDTARIFVLHAKMASEFFFL